MGAQNWEVVGGKDNGGILVRELKDLKSPTRDERLSFGALIEEVALEGERLHYKRLTGSGPKVGWVSLQLKGKPLVVKTEKTPQPSKPKFDPYAILGISPDATDAMIKSAYRKASVKCHPDRNPDDPDAAQKFQELTKAKEFLLNPLKRLIYNAQNKLIKPTVNEKWWSDWDEIFDELDADDERLEDADHPAPALSLKEGRVDILIMGATGMTGTMACMLMQRQHSRTWAIAGRDGRKLDRIVERFGNGGLFRGSTRVESQDDLEKLAKMARVVMDFRGPMFQVGEEFGKACVREGTHYLVVSGDVLFNKPFREQVNQEAKAKGVLISSGTGIMSSLCDFAVWNIVKYVREKFGLPTRRVDKYAFAVGQMTSGSMIATGLARNHEEVDKEIDEGGGPFYLGGIRSCGVREDEKERKYPAQDPVSGMWSMGVGSPDRHYVRCSCGMFDSTQPYGDKFLFKDHTIFKAKHEAEQSMMMGEFARRFYNQYIEQKRMPPPGSGPNERLRQQCFETMVLVAEAEEPEGKEDPQKVHAILRSGPGGMADRFQGAATLTLEQGFCLLDAIDAGRQHHSGWGTPTWHFAHLGFFDRLLSLGIVFKIIDQAPDKDFFKNLVNSTLPIGDDMQ